MQFLPGLLHQIQKFFRLPIDLLQLVIQILNLQKRFHLTCNTTHILSAEDRSAVGTILQISLMQSSHDSAGIVAHMLITNGSAVAAIVDLAIGIPGDSTGVRVGRHVFRAVE